MSEKLYTLADSGQLEEMVDLACEDGGEQDGTMYRWLLVASSLPNDARAEARDWAADFFEFELKGANEPAARARFDVARWFIMGENGVAQNAKRGLAHLEEAKKLGIAEFVSEEALRELESQS